MASTTEASMNRKLRNLVLRLGRLMFLVLNGFWAVPAVAIIRFARPWMHVRMFTLDSSRVGHFIAESSICLAHSALKSPNERTADLYWFPSRACNEQWARMVRRQLYVRWWVRYLIRFNSLIPGGVAHRGSESMLSSNRETYSILQRTKARFDFTPQEEEAAKNWLRNRGWRDYEPFVCLAVRDSAYLESDPLHASGEFGHWSYHNYRDSDVSAYTESIRQLVDRGYWVIRMGKIMRERLSFQHQRVIDYPFVEDQDDLIDIWLGANCQFFVSSGTGIDTTPTMYGKCVIFVNSLPLNLVFSSVKQIWVPKHLRWRNSGSLLTLMEHCRHGYVETTGYAKAGIVIENLSPSEITAAVMEGEQRTTGTWIETKADQDRQRRFWEVLRSWPDFSKFHGDVHPEARIGCAWLRSMGNAFLE